MQHSHEGQRAATGCTVESLVLGVSVLSAASCEVRRQRSKVSCKSQSLKTTGNGRAHSLIHQALPMLIMYTMQHQKPKRTATVLRVVSSRTSVLYDGPNKRLG
eukprot:1037031-Pleurochrysis_carterae.AAC.3